MFDTQAYRTRGEVEQWKQRDPIERLRAWMTGNHELTEIGRASCRERV